MRPGARVRFTDASPWPERVGCEGVVVEEPNGPGVYPDDKRDPNRVIVLLDDDPLVPPDRRPSGWTCATTRDSFEVVG